MIISFGMKVFLNLRCACAATLLLGSASTAGASGFTFDPNPRTHPDASAEVIDLQHLSGSGLLSVCGNPSLRPNPDSHTQWLPGSPGCAGGAFPGGAPSFNGGGIGLEGADATALLQGTFADFELVGSDDMSSLEIFRLLAALTASEPGLGHAAFTEAEINTNRVRAADFLAWFRNEAGVTDAVPVEQEFGAFWLFRVGLAALAAAAVVAEIIFLGVSFLLRRAAGHPGPGK